MQLRIFTLALVLLAFCACNSSTQKGETKADKTTETQDPKPKEPAAPKAKFTDLTVEQFKDRMGEKNIVLLDVRTAEETAEGKIEGAVEIDVLADDFSSKIQTLDRSKTYLVYCRSGGRSVDACNIMADAGFQDLYNLLGGYTAWSE